MFSRFSLYFDEVARRGSIRRASDRLHIAPSAIDRQILLMEQRLGAKLFERMPQGLRLTAAGELLVDAVRRWRRELDRVKTQIDDLQGLRRGEVVIAVVEGALEFLSASLAEFQARYPSIIYNIHVAGAQPVVDAILSSRAEIGLTFNPVVNAGLRLERTLIYQIGAVIPPGHALASKTEVSVLDCNDHPLIIPDESIPLRAVLDETWRRNAGVTPRSVAVANNVGSIRAMTKAGLGVGLLTPLDALSDISSGQLVFVPLAGKQIPLSLLSLVHASGRTLSAPASSLLQHLSASMLAQEAPNV